MRSKLKRRKEYYKKVDFNSPKSIKLFNHYSSKYGFKYRIVKKGNQMKTPLEAFSSLPKKNKPKLPIKNTFDIFTKQSLEHIMSLHWFIKHRRNSKSYENSLFAIRKCFKRYRSKTLEIFELGNSYFSNPRFIYHPKKSISAAEFVKFSKDTINRNKFLQELKVKSWFDEFALGKEHIERNFVKRQKDKYPELTKRVEVIWNKFKRNETINPIEHDNIVVFVSMAVEFQKLNSDKITSVNEIIEVLKNTILLSDSYVKNTSFLITKYFWTNTVPIALVKFGLIKHHEKVRFLK